MHHNTDVNYNVGSAWSTQELQLHYFHFTLLLVVLFTFSLSKLWQKKRVLTVTRAFGFHMMIKSIRIKFRQLDSVVETVAPLGLIGWVQILNLNLHSGYLCLHSWYLNYFKYHWLSDQNDTVNTLEVVVRIFNCSTAWHIAFQYSTYMFLPLHFLYIFFELTEMKWKCLGAYLGFKLYK